VSDNNNKDEILTLIEDDNIVFKKLKELRANPNNSTIKWVKVYTTWVLGKDGDIVSSTGKRMTDNNYTTEEKEKLASLENYDDTEIAADVEKLKTETAADVEKLKTETAADVEKLNSDVETLGSDIESLKTEVTENKNSCETDINDVKQKTQYILANGDAIQTDGLLSLIGKTQTMVGVTDDEDRTLYRNWENILSGIRFTSDGIEIKSGGGSITIDGDGVNITSGDAGISVGSDGTSFVGSTPYEGTTEMLGVTENEIISCDVSDIETTEED
jgi:hypothetical protein